MGKADFIIEYPIFRSFDLDDLEVLDALCEQTVLGPGELACKEGDPGDAMYVVQEGLLEVSREHEGRRHHINLLSQGEFFGEMALIDGSPRSATITAQERATLLRLSREAFAKLKVEHPAVGFKLTDVLLKTLSFRLRRTVKSATEAQAQVAKAAPKPKPKSKPKLKPSPKPKAKAKAKRKARKAGTR